MKACGLPDGRNCGVQLRLCKDPEQEVAATAASFSTAPPALLPPMAAGLHQPVTHTCMQDFLM